MNNYKNNNNKFSNSRGGQRSDKRSYDRPRFGSQNSDRNQMHDAVCADCGGNCKVPFMPSSGKPVYCSNCFEKRGNGKTGSNRSFSRQSPRTQENYSKQFETINYKLDKILKILSAKEE